MHGVRGGDGGPNAIPVIPAGTASIVRHVPTYQTDSLNVPASRATNWLSVMVTRCARGHGGTPVGRRGVQSELAIHHTMGCWPSPSGGVLASATSALRSLFRPSLVRGKRAWWQ